MLPIEHLEDTTLKKVKKISKIKISAGEISRIRGQRAFTSIDLNRKTGLVVASNTDAVPRLYDPRSKGRKFKQFKYFISLSVYQSITTIQLECMNKQ